MRTDFTPITSALASLTAAITDVHKSLLNKANAERVEALVLFAKMRETHEDMETFAGIVGAAATELAGIEEVAVDVSAKVYDAIEAADFPECDYEEFVEFCDGCGKSITFADDYTVTTDGEHFCADCLPDEDEDFDESVEAEIDESDETEVDSVE